MHARRVDASLGRSNEFPPVQMALSAGRFCMAEHSPVASGSTQFVTITSDSRRGVLTPGAPDFVLEHEEAVPPSSALTSAVPDAEAVAMRARLDALARRTSVRPSQASILLSAHEFGVGSTINSMVMVVLDALGRGHTLFLPRLRLWAQPNLCARADMSCFFDSLPSLVSLRSSRLPAHPASAEVRRNRKHWDVILGALTECSGKRCPDRVQRTYNVCRTEQIACPRLLKRTVALKLNESVVLRRLPAQWVGRGRFWLISQVLAWLTKPNSALQQRLEAAKAMLRFEEHQPVLAVHVRKGDACTARGECRGLAHFMPQVWRFASAYGFRSVFLSTPSADVQAETTRYPRFQWLYINSTDTSAAMAKRRIARIEDGLRQRAFGPLHEWQRYMLDVYLIAASQAVVGSFSSNAARLAYSLMAASDSSDCLKPFYSGDNNWCWAFGRAGGQVVRKGSGAADGPGWTC